ncbi:dienelactone hydrolase [Micromonospora sp. A200]|uniref:alpha/beta hydrolase family protein n=1 Tax=Micromonospora sp. A200 TaxID=2940568 RepID=UPI00247359B7|nr:hypothetical protein [Micromonospora sp. A200]MDH6462733.1 dienelactone hydrolase [Micromonospora sp. A200]
MNTQIRRSILIGSLLFSVLAGGHPAVAAAAEPARLGSYTGTIDGAAFRVEVPRRWNGTLMLYSHGYIPPGTPQSPAHQIALATRPQTQNWLLEHGYALAASNYRSSGYAVEDALNDQVKLLNWFSRNVGRPHRTISTGASMGGGIAVRLAERHPHRFVGVLAQCADLDQNGTWNMALDLAFTIKTLLPTAHDVELVNARDPDGSRDALIEAAMQAAATPDGRARLALAGALGNIPGWLSAHQPRPTQPIDRITAQATWIVGAYLWGMGPTARADLEHRAGGNPSWNVGINYDHQLARSAQRDLVEQAYREADLDLNADLARLAAAPRIAPDPVAVRHMYRSAVPTGRTPAPVITLHGTGDGGAVVDQQRWYATQVRRSGDPARLRQLYINRGSHCAFNAAEEITTLRTLITRIDTGRWPSTEPDQLNATTNAFDPKYHTVHDLFSQQEATMPPAFTRHDPPTWLRPSR